MKRPIQHKIGQLVGAYLVGFLVILVFLTYWQVLAAHRLLGDPHNPRLARLERRIERGTIYDRNGVALAKTIFRGMEGERIYPLSEAAGPTLGYVSQRYGRAGLEASFGPQLSGIGPTWTWNDLKWLVSEKRKRGDDLYLTLDAKLQKAAYQALRLHRGAVVAIQPRTGEILALVSRPSFDPQGIDEQFDELVQAKPSRLINRATQGLYPPGSSFKIITAAAALEEGVVQPSTRFHCSGSVEINGYQVKCFGGTVHGEIDFGQALMYSCNCTFSQVAVKLGADRIIEYAKRFGFGRRPDLPVPVSVSRVARPGSRLSDTMVAQTGFGQGEVVATPLQMALVVAAIANEGVLMKPYLVKEIRRVEGRTDLRGSDQASGRVISPAVAQQLKTMMVGVVRQGTGRAARIAGVSIAGKTGTAENPHGRPHAWFVCFAPAEDPEIALAVVVENGGQGGRRAASIARKILEAAGY